MFTTVDVSRLIDIFDIEGVLFEHPDVHCVGIVGRLTDQMPLDSFGALGLLVPNSKCILISSSLSKFVLGTSCTP